jgi:hypothetical protein
VPLTILFWDVGGGFIDGEKSGDGDLFCFPPQKTQKKIVLKKCTASRGIRCGILRKIFFQQYRVLLDNYARREAGTNKNAL